MRIVFSLVLTVLNRHANHYLLLLILVNLQFSCVFFCYTLLLFRVVLSTNGVVTIVLSRKLMMNIVNNSHSC